MRTTVVARFRASTFLLLSLLLFVGCSGGSDEPEAYTKETGPPVEGMVWNESAESWEFPAPGSYDRESGGYGDGYDDGYGGTSNDEVADQGSAYDDDANSDDGDEDAYASSGGSSDDTVDDSYGADDYGGGDSIRPPADLDEQREREASRNQGYDAGYDAYASTDGGNSASGGYGAPGADGGYGPPGESGGGGGFYKEQIEPLLRAHCYNCHGGGPRGKKGDLELHNPEVIGDSGTLVAYKPDDSELFYRISLEQGDEQRMPPRGKGLSAQEVALFKKWIQDGANFGGGGGGRGDGYGGTDPYANSGRGGRGDDGVGDDEDDDPYGEADGDPERPAPPKNLAEAASVSFQRGDDLVAMSQLYAQSLLNESEVAKKVLESYQYFPLRRRATLAVRWGVGVTFKGKYGFEGAPRPPGVNQEIRGLDDDDEAVDAYESVEIKNDALDYYTGDLGDELIVRLQNRIDRGYYGPILQAELKKRMEGDGDSFDDDGDYDDGGYGRGGGGYEGSSDGGYGRGGGGGSSDKPDDDEITQVMPGVVMLGQADRRKLFSRAKEQGVDVLVTIDILSEPDRRQRIVNSEFRVRLFDVANQKTVLATSGKIKNVDLQKKRAKDADDETLLREMDKIFAVADEGTTIKDKKIRPLKVVQFPETSSKAAKASILKTVRSLLNNADISPLAKLSEVKFYESKGLMSSQHTAKAFEVIDASKAKKLASVTDESELQDLLSEWLIVDEPEDDEDDERGDDDRPRRPRQREFR